MKKLYVLSIALMCLGSSTYAQTIFYNNGAQVAITDNCPVIAFGAVENTGVTALLKNKGDFNIESDFINRAGANADGFASGLGNYRVKGNWDNSGIFTADQSNVYLAGNSQQITGSSVTTFHNLILQNANSVKAQTIDAAVKGTLTLNQNELFTGNNSMTITNPAVGAIVQNGVNDAFVSSTDVGRLIRATNTTSEYLFPTGWQNGGTKKIREVSITPTNSDAHNFSVRFAQDNLSTTTTSSDGFSIATKQGNVQQVNDVFYHLVSSSDAAPAALGIHYEQAGDGAWKSIGRWQGQPQWEDLLSAAAGAGQAGSGRVRLTKNSWNPTKDHAHALINTQDVKYDFNFPNVFAPASTTAKPEDIAFTIINKADLVTLEELSVFNRWGEMVFNSKRDGSDSWNGQYQGKLQQQANYVFLASVRKKDTNELFPPISGNVTLVW